MPRSDTTGLAILTHLPEAPPKTVDFNPGSTPIERDDSIACHHPMLR